MLTVPTQARKSQTTFPKTAAMKYVKKDIESPFDRRAKIKQQRKIEEKMSNRAYIWFHDKHDHCFSNLSSLLLYEEFIQRLYTQKYQFHLSCDHKMIPTEHYLSNLLFETSTVADHYHSAI